MSSDEESRPPTIEDLVQVCKALNDKKAKYIVVGGMAMIQHGFVRATEDIDFLVKTGKDNEKKIIEALLCLPDQAVAELVPGDIDQYEVIRVADEVVVDLMKYACGMEYQSAEKEIIFVEIQGAKIPFASIELMKKLKQGIREKDKMDLMFLSRLKK